MHNTHTHTHTHSHINEPSSQGTDPQCLPITSRMNVLWWLWVRCILYKWEEDIVHLNKKVMSKQYTFTLLYTLKVVDSYLTWCRSVLSPAYFMFTVLYCCNDLILSLLDLKVNHCVPGESQRSLTSVRLWWWRPPPRWCGEGRSQCQWSCRCHRSRCRWSPPCPRCSGGTMPWLLRL